MFKLLLALLLTCTVSSYGNDRHDRILELEQEIKQLEAIKERLNAALGKTKADDQLLLPLYTEGNWIAMPVAKDELNSLLSLWVIMEKQTPDEVIELVKKAVEFKAKYQDEAIARIQELENKIAFQKNIIQELNDEFPSKKLEPPSAAAVTLAVENVKVSNKPGYRRWDFDWVFIEHEDVGVTLSEYELNMTSPIPGANKTFKDKTNIRIEGGHIFRGPGYMWLEDTTGHEKEANMHAQLHSIFKGQDDNGQPIVVENFFYQ
jgi:hypothetical protein